MRYFRTRKKFLHCRELQPKPASTMSEEGKKQENQDEKAFDKAKKKAKELKEEAKGKAEEIKKELKEDADKVKEKAKELKEEAKEKAHEAREKAGKIKDDVKEDMGEFKEEAKKTAEEFKEGLRTATADGDNKKILAGLLAIFLGWAGIHKFILGYQKEGIIMLVLSVIGLALTCIGIGFFITWAVGIIGLVEGIIYLTKSDEDFYNTYQAGKRPWF